MSDGVTDLLVRWEADAWPVENSRRKNCVPTARRCWNRYAKGFAGCYG